MGHRVLPDFPEKCKPLTLVIGSGKSNFRPEKYTCLADRKRTARRKEDIVEVRETEEERKKNNNNDENNWKFLLVSLRFE